MRKIRYRLLLRTLVVFCVLTSLFFSFLIAFSFRAQFEQERAHAVTRLSDAIRGLQSACTAYAIQGLSPGMDTLQEIAAQYACELSPCAEDALPEYRSYARGGALFAQAQTTLGSMRCSVRLRTDLNALYASRNRLTGLYKALYLIFLPLGAMLLYAAGRSITRPIEKITAAARALAAGDLSARSDISAPDETGRLAQSFNSMADSVQREMRRREELIGNLTHEMKTPLQAIIGHADLIRLDKLSDAQKLASLETILREAGRLNALSARMMEWIDLSLQDSMHMTGISVARMLENVKRALETRVLIETSAEEACALADGPMMETLLMNLIDNSINAGATRIALTAKRSGGKIEISVTDNGSGMDRETMARAEEPFYRADKARTRAHGGAGLGLALCRRIADGHGARLRYESEPKRGTRVSIMLSEVSGA